MSKRDEEEARAKRWLEAQGYKVRSPDWLPKTSKGNLNPDYWAEADAHEPHALWVEVKSPEDDDIFELLGKHDALIERAERALPPGMKGYATLHYSEATAQRSIRWVLDTFVRKAREFGGEKVTLAFVQQTKHGRDTRRVEIAASVPEVIWLQGAGAAPLHTPLQVADEYHAPTVVIDDQGERRSGSAYQFFDGNTLCDCALVAHLDPTDKPLEGIAVMSGGSSASFDRIVDDLKFANRQIKTAYQSCAAPGIVIIAPRDRLTDSFSIQAACYGRHGFRFWNKKGKIESEDGMHHGRDGIFRSTKNRHVSAAVHVREDGSATFYPNPFAYHPIADEAPLFLGALRANVRFV